MRWIKIIPIYRHSITSPAPFITFSLVLNLTSCLFIFWDYRNQVNSEYAFVSMHMMSLHANIGNEYDLKRIGIYNSLGTGYDVVRCDITLKSINFIKIFDSLAAKNGIRLNISLITLLFAHISSECDHIFSAPCISLFTTLKILKFDLARLRIETSQWINADGYKKRWLFSSASQNECDNTLSFLSVRCCFGHLVFCCPLIVLIGFCLLNRQSINFNAKLMLREQRLINSLQSLLIN